MIIPFVGQAYQMDAVSFDNQRSVNMYPIFSESGTSRTPVALRSVAGRETFATCSGGTRGCIESADRAFFVAGDKFCEVLENGTTVEHGTLGTFTSNCQLEENPTQVMIIDGLNGYIFTKSSNTFVQITDANFPTPSSLTFQDGYFIVAEEDTSKFYISGLNNGLTWGALDFTTVESSPDKLVAVKSNRSNLFCFGTKVTEIYQNTGNVNFPFQRISGAFIQTGCAAPDSIVNIDNRLFWLGQDENGDSIVWQSEGYSSAKRISTQPIERKIVESTRFDESTAFSYHERGHAFYCLNVKGLNTTLVYDISTQSWHERVYREPLTADEQQDRPNCHLYAFNKHLLGDSINGKIYNQSLSIYDHDGDPMIKKRISPYIAEEKNLVSHAQLELDIEVGRGLNTGQGSDPQIMMRYSDNGYTWSAERTQSLGKMGEYNTRVKWNRLGRARQRVYEISVSDPVFVQINGAYLNGK